MSESRYTAGPWGAEYTDEAIWIGPMRADGEKVREIVVGVEFGTEYTRTFKERARANARLIAAAPDLLEALKALALYADECALLLKQHGYPAKAQSLGQRVAQADAALSKAQGAE